MIMIKELFIVENNTSFQLSKNKAVGLANRVSPSALIKLLAYISSRLSKLILLACHSGSHRHPREGGNHTHDNRKPTIAPQTVKKLLRVSPSSPRRREPFSAKVGTFTASTINQILCMYIKLKPTNQTHTVSITTHALTVIPA